MRLFIQSLSPNQLIIASPNVLQERGKLWKVGHKNPLEFAERLLVKNDVVQVAGRDAGFLQAELDGSLRKAEVVLDPGEPLFLGGGDQLPVPEEGRGRVMVKTGDPEDVHQDCFLKSSISGEISVLGDQWEPWPRPLILRGSEKTLTASATGAKTIRKRSPRRIWL